MGSIYTAFISYRHAPADTAAASEIQRRLERYHIPKAIREKTGMESIGRIFRDKEELPITSNLGDDISEALMDAGFLIVICSTSTKESTWVEREIRFFLEHHSRKQVLTVLVDGEPGDVIPEIILRDGDTVMEPLSCDFRGGVHAAARTEIPRLAAALIGCRYDDLVMRERQYRRRRLTAILGTASALAVIAISYLLWSRNEIRKNYVRAEANYQEARRNLDRSLLNQSVYLASESAKLLGEGDRLRAITLAMKALPSEGNERPLSPRAEAALANALKAYTPPYRESSYASLAETAELRTRGRITDYVLSDDMRYLFTCDDSCRASVWDLDGLALRYEIRQPDTIEGILPLGENALAVLTAEGLSVYDYAAREMLWSFTDESVVWGSSSICESGGRIFLASLRREKGGSGDAVSLHASLFDAGSGRLLAEGGRPAEFSPFGGVRCAAASPDGGAFAFAAGEEDFFSEESTPVGFYVFRSSSGTLDEVPAGSLFARPECIRFLDGETFLAIGYPEYTISSMGSGEYLEGDMVMIRDYRVNVASINARTGEMLWQNHFSSGQLDRVPARRKLGIVPLADRSGNKRPFAVCLYANAALLLDPHTGQIHDRVEFTAPIVDSHLGEDGTLMFCLANGSTARYDASEPGQATEISVLPGQNFGMSDVSPEGQSTTRFLVRTGANTIRTFRETSDGAFARYGDAALPADAVPQVWGTAGGCLFIQDFDRHLYLLDLSGGEPLRTLVLGNEAGRYEYIGKDEAGGCIWFLDKASADTDGCDLLRVDTAAGVQQAVSVEGCDGIGHRILPDGSLAFFDRKDHSVKRYEYREDAFANVLSVQAEDAWNLNFFLSPDGGTLLESTVPGMFDEGDARIHLHDIASGGSHLLSLDAAAGIQGAAWNDGGTLMAVTDGQSVFLLTRDGRLVASVSENSESVVSIAFREDLLLVLYSGGKLTRYDAFTGELLGRTGIAHYAKESFMADVEWRFDGDTLYLDRRSLGAHLLHGIGLPSFEERFHTQYALGFDAARDRIVSCGPDPETGKQYLGYFPRYSARDLLEKGEAALNGYVMPEEELEGYGIE